nr:3'-5' exonuclease [candidate division Zixibacteria bacterium]NIR48344.1 3'-5' exonuclease [candidate division KSB1 bacterium]NIR63581.1 3'-5' exonuclease [candidate division Zixibacteria bacterium]NIS45545.1 3'-5' exonuclease [candidate division Zixibacteria bacterium]NIT54459.1 3'-5' exonuclease [candidate division Zixibacteria bacterium]
MEKSTSEMYISVDIETSGPNPSRYSILSIGACTVFEPVEIFYVEFKPISMDAKADALKISKLSMERLIETGVEPETGMREFTDWLERVVPDGKKPVFVAFNAPFDWMFVNDY